MVDRRDEAQTQQNVSSDYGLSEILFTFTSVQPDARLGVARPAIWSI